MRSRLLLILLSTIEGITFLATVVLVCFWIKAPNGPIEPWTVACGCITALIEIVRRNLPSEQGENSDDRRWLQRNMYKENLTVKLPRALNFAREVEDPAFKHWVKLEMHGYTTESEMRHEDKIPKYRSLDGQWMDDYENTLRRPASSRRVPRWPESRIWRLPIPNGVVWKTSS